MLGFALWLFGCLLGGSVQFYALIIKPLHAKGGAGPIYVNELIALSLALPACLIYMWVPLLLDRFDPEPWWALAMAAIWGALAATGAAYAINTEMGHFGQELLGDASGKKIFGAVISAPLVEESSKAAVVLGMFLFLRREFDGIVDGVIYAIFSALGFAMLENVLYYSRGLTHDGLQGLTDQFLLRGVLKPWGHPLYTSMTGLGIGIARETQKGWLKIAAPLGGFVIAVTLHAGWNGSSLVGKLLKMKLTYIVLAVYFFVMLAFLGLMIVLVAREGKKLRENLGDEVLAGYMTQGELDLVCAPFGKLTARVRHGAAARDFVKAAARLGLAKWHLARATENAKSTVSFEQIAPLRARLAELRQQIGGSIA